MVETVVPAGVPTPVRRVLAALGVLLILGSVFGKAGRLGTIFLGMTPLASTNLFWWSLAVLVPLYVVAVERLPLSSIGLKRPNWKTVAFGLGAVVIAFAILPLIQFILALLHAQGQEGSPQANALFALPWWFRAQLVLRATFAEEFVFRGYLIERVEQLTGSRIAAFAVSVAAFSLAHLSYWGWSALIGVGAVGIIAALFYQWRRDLGVTMVMHFVLDGMQLLL